MPLSVEFMLSEWTNVAICLVFAFTINILEKVSTRLSFLGFKFKKISFKVNLTTLYYLSVMFNFMKTIAILAFGTIYMVDKSGMFPLPTILILRNIRIHVGFLDGYNMLFYIEISVDKTFSLCTILRVSNVDLYNSHIRLERGLDDMRMGH